MAHSAPTDGPLVQTYTPIIDIVRGSSADEIRLVQPPNPLDPAHASSLTAYIRSFYAPSYRTEWVSIDEQTLPPTPVEVPIQVAGEKSVPRKAKSTNSATYTDVSLKTIQKRWEVKVWAKSTEDSVETPVFGFSVRPRISILTLHVYLWLLLPAAIRERDWTVRRRKADGCTGEILNWRIDEEVEFGDFVLRDRQNGPLVAIGETDLPRFPKRKTGSRAVSGGFAGYSVAEKSGSSEPSKASRNSLNGNDVRGRDLWCQISGRDFAAEAGGPYGKATCAHIVPYSRSDIVDLIRWSFSPTYWGLQRPPSYIRMATNNHPGNELRSLKSFENQFDDFTLSIDPLKRQPTLRMMTGLMSTLQLYEPAEFSVVYGSGDFPQPSRNGGNTSSVPLLPPVNTAALLIHLTSALFANCMVQTAISTRDSEEVDHARSSVQALDDPILFWQDQLDLDMDIAPLELTSWNDL